MGAAASTNPQWQSRSEKPSRQLFGGSSGGDYILFWETVESELMVFDTTLDNYGDEKWVAGEAPNRATKQSHCLLDGCTRVPLFG